MEIRVHPDPILSRICRSDFVIPERVIAEMFSLLRKHRALGLAAPQVGIDARFFITHWGEVFINPVPLYNGSQITVREGCLSFPGIITSKQRYLQIRVGGQFYQNEQAIIIQHELEHLNGITIA